MIFLIIRKGVVNFTLVKFNNLQMPEQTYRISLGKMKSRNIQS